MFGVEAEQWGRGRGWTPRVWDNDGVDLAVNDASIGHACGVFGVYAPGQHVAHLTYLGLYALQHRGQESAGIAVSDGETITVSKDMGLVTQVFDERRLAPLDGPPRHRPRALLAPPARAAGATRSRSTGRSATPASRSATTATSPTPLSSPSGSACSRASLPGDSASARLHHRLRARRRAHRPRVRAQARCDGRDLERALAHVLPQLEGGFSFVLMDEAHLIGVRDPHGFWPLVPRAARRRLGARERDRRRSTSSAPTSSARSSRAR